MADDQKAAGSDVFIFGGGGRANLLDEKPKPLPVRAVKENLENFMGAVRDLLPSVQQAGAYGLKSVDVAVGINAKGQVGFLGTGAELGGTATLTLKFERPT